MRWLLVGCARARLFRGWSRRREAAPSCSVTAARPVTTRLPLIMQLAFHGLEHRELMRPFVELDRRFRDLTQAELSGAEPDDPGLLASLRDSDLGTTPGWPELLEEPRVLLLAEGGSGKTREMRELARRLAAQGESAFFVPIDVLEEDGLSAVLSTAEQRRLEEWSTNAEKVAWFFLDAVDELKLTAGKLDRALNRFSREIEGGLHRARILVSCRPLDWLPERDMETMVRLLPFAPPSQAMEASPEDLFLSAIQHDRAPHIARAPTEQPKTSEPVRVVALLPLSRQQIETFARAQGVDDVDGFLNEIKKQRAWSFARRPFDLIELITSWRDLGHVGTRLQQHELNVTSRLRDVPERPDNGVLTESKARQGAERLALALAMTRTRAIRSPEQSFAGKREARVLDPAAVLPDWTEAERSTLLRRAVFDPATYGRVRFHHRSIEEYLAACRLKRLRDEGMPAEALLRMLFTTKYGEDVAIPSLRPISSWLALWDAPVRRELSRREPETLLSLGDPQSLPVEDRSRLVRAFVDACIDGGARGINIPIDEVRRLSEPSLGPLVSELWSCGKKNRDVRELLLEMMWQGALSECWELAHEAALDKALPSYHRAVAIRALLATGHESAVRTLVETLLAEPSAWPDKLTFDLAPDLFPKILSVSELRSLLERIREPRSSTSGFGWSVRLIAQATTPGTALAIELRDQLASLVWSGREAGQKYWADKGRYDHLIPALATLVDKQLSLQTMLGNAELVTAAVQAHRAGGGARGNGREVRSLKKYFVSDQGLREKAFWAELQLMDEMIPSEDPWHRFFYAEHESIIAPLAEADRPWLKRALDAVCTSGRRAVALQALHQLWLRAGRVPGAMDDVTDLISGDAHLSPLLEGMLSPRPAASEEQEAARQVSHYELAAREREAKETREWMTWRDNLMSNPVLAFSPAQVSTTLFVLYDWLHRAARRLGEHDDWNETLVSTVFGADVAALAAAAFQAAWRSAKPPVRHAWPRSVVDHYDPAWQHGLCGLSSEALKPGWAERLSVDEARNAAAYAMVDQSLFPRWVTELAQSHPSTVEDAFGVALEGELANGGARASLPVLVAVTHADDAVKRLMSNRLLRFLENWSCRVEEDQIPRWRQHIGQVLEVLQHASSQDGLAVLRSECLRRLHEDAAGPLAVTWLSCLFHVDPVSATDCFEVTLEHAVGAEGGVHLFDSLFGERDGLSLDAVADATDRATMLGRLIRRAYEYVRPAEDMHHDGNYTPAARDRAENARDYLLNKLLGLTGAEAHAAVIELAEHPLLGHIADRLRLLARQRAAADAEFAAYSPASLADLEKRHELLPHDRDSLFSTMMARLADLAHRIAHDDFTDRAILQQVTDEPAMQSTLAMRLRDMSRGAYHVVREDEVADRKKPDIRLVAAHGDQKAALELKLADKWSLEELERALRHQLVGQYLRSDRCRAGCLLLTYNGQKKYWCRDAEPPLSFAQLVNYLSAVGRQLERDKSHVIRVAVFGLDLTDPVLVPAHRRRAKA